MEPSLFKKEFCSEQSASKLLWGVLFAWSIVSLNVIVEQIGYSVNEADMVAAPAQASSTAKSVLKEVPMTPSRAPEETDSIIVKYKDTTSPGKKGDIEKGEKLKKKSDIPQINVVVYDVDQDDTGREVAERMKLSRKDDIEYVEVDMKVYPNAIPNDPLYAGEWHLDGSKLNAASSWDRTSGEGITIAILDSGVNCAHEDLAVNCVPGWNIVSNNTDTADIHGHGTAVAGTAASRGNNALGGVGVAYGAKIMPIRITNDPTGWAYYSTIASGIIWAADHGVRVASNSYASWGDSTVQNAAAYMRNKGGVVIVSAGNDTAYKTEANSSGITVVSATDANDQKTSWTNYGTPIDVSAPGLNVYCIWGGYGSCWGTSFSAPLTAGIYALMFSVNPALTPNQADNILFSTADDLGEPGWDMYYGWGRVNAAKAVAMAVSTTGGNVPDTQAPSVPGNLSATNVTASAVTLTWGASVDNVGVASYDIYRNGTKLTTVSGTQYTDSGLGGSTAYTYTVAARDAAGNTSAQSGSVSITTATAPLAIESSAVTVKTGTTASIAVTTSKPSTVTVKYGLTATALTGTMTTSTTGTSHVVSLTGLKVKSKYFYQVTATNTTGETAVGPVSNFRTGAR